MKKVSLFPLLASLSLCLLSGCKADPEAFNNVPKLMAFPAEDITTTSALLSGWIEQFDAVSEFGIVVGSTSDFSSSDTTWHPFLKSGESKFSIPIDNLSPEATYLYAAYAKSDAGDKLLSPVQAFTTLRRVGGVDFLDFHLVDPSEALFYAEFSIDNDRVIERAGICWSTAPNPTIEDLYIEADLNSDNSFTAVPIITDINRTYHVRAWAESSILNNSGTSNLISYSESIEFKAPEELNSQYYIKYTTLDNAPITLSNIDAFGANILSNNYDEDFGIIIFDGPVTKIGNNAFYECRSLTNITIPEGVASIGNNAFYECRSLTNITIPEGVVSIGNNAFYECRSLTNITIPYGVISIGDSAFKYCFYLTSITIPEGVTSIGGNAFEDCSKLASITIPNGITSIRSHTFFKCSSLANITIPESVTSIEDFAFYECNSLTNVTIPDSVTSIEESVFDGCSGLTNVIIGNGVNSIGDSAFSYCTSLTSVTIGDSVTSIGDFAFIGCSALTSVTLPDSVSSIGVGAFSVCDGLTSITIPDSVTSIGSMAFSDCFSLRSATISNNITSIGELAFLGCYNLTAFYGKYVSEDNRCLIVNGVLNSVAPAGLTFCSIPNNVTSIGRSAFSDCSMLKKVTIPDSVTSIREDAFSNCTFLKVVYCMPTTPPMGDDRMFEEIVSDRKIYVPAESVEEYRAAKYWSTYANSIVGYKF